MQVTIIKMQQHLHKFTIFYRHPNMFRPNRPTSGQCLPNTRLYKNLQDIILKINVSTHNDLVIQTRKLVKNMIMTLDNINKCGFLIKKNVPVITAWQQVNLKMLPFLLIKIQQKLLILMVRVVTVLLESKQQIRSIFHEFWIYNIHPTVQVPVHSTVACRQKRNHRARV